MKLKEINIEAIAGRIAREIMDDLSDRYGYEIQDDDKSFDRRITLAWKKIVMDTIREYRGGG